MNIDNILKLLKSSNEDDILLGYTILSEKLNLDEIREKLKPFNIWSSVVEGHQYIKILRVHHNPNYQLDSNWIKID